MSAVVPMLLIWAVTLVLAGTVAALMWRPLRILLGELCATEERSHFWSVYSTIMIVLIPLMAVSYFGTEIDAATLVRRTVFYALGGVGLALVAIGWTVAQSRPATPFIADPIEAAQRFKQREGV